MPGNQAHVTNLKENPALLAADAAEAAARGFAEMETTVGVARYAPLNAIALLVGSQTGRPGVMTQCAVEERRNLELAIHGLVTYAETLSVYGTEPVFADGDDTPWSKAFLASAYASRGVKVRFTSGTGSEALMGHAQGCSMLYLEARCLAVIRAAGSQGVQNGSISCVALVLAVPGGTRAILAENMIAAWLDLEVASGNDAIASHSAIRKTAKLMGQFLPGHRLRHLRLLGDAARRQHVRRRQLRRRRPRRVADDPARLAGRRGDRAGLRGRGDCASASGPRGRCRRCSRSSGCRPSPMPRSRPRPIGYDSRDMPDRDRAADVEAADAALERGVSGLDVALALDRRGFGEIAEAIVGMQRQRVSADYLQTSAVIDADGLVHSAVNDPNVYLGPGTGYRLEGERWQLLQSLPHATPVERARLGATATPAARRAGRGRARRGGRRRRPGGGRRRRRARFRDGILETINGLTHDDVLDAVVRGDSRGRRDAAARAGAAGRRRRLHRPRRREALRLGCRRRAPVERARRSSIAPTCSRSTTWSCSGCRRSTRASRIARSASTRPVMRSATASARCRRSSTTSRGRS